MAGLIDWDLAARTAKKLSPAPPAVPRAEAADVVDELYRATDIAAAHVAELTRLVEPPVKATTRVVDRDDWVDVNVAGMAAVMSPIVDKLATASPMGKIGEAVGGRVTGVQAGAVIGFLSGKVLGQFEFFDKTAAQVTEMTSGRVRVKDCTLYETDTSFARYSE